MLDQDTSANMALNDAKSAMKVFIDLMNPTTTQIGLQTFGNTLYDPGPLIDIASESPNFPSLSSMLDGLVKGQGSGTMQSSIETSYAELNAHATGTHSGDTKVLILLSDGGSNMANQGGLTGLITTAKNSEIYIFPICYSNNCKTGLAPEEMNTLAVESGGKFYTAKTANELTFVFNDISEKIWSLATQGSTMTVSFEDIVINKTYTAKEGSAYEYIPVGIPAGLTVGVMSAPSATVNPDARTSIIWPDKNQSIQNQIEEYPDLRFDVGKIKITEEWSTTFSLKAKYPGCYNVFNSTSIITFGGESLPMTLPDLPICVNSVVTQQGLLAGTLKVEDLQTVPSGGTFTNFIPLQWNTNYNSSTSTNIATEYVSYRINGGPWNQFGALSVPSTDLSQTTTLSKTLDIRNLPSGNYDIWVRATAIDANDADQQITVEVLGSGPRDIHIKLQ
jgi:hypothetical protein